MSVFAHAIRDGKGLSRVSKLEPLKASDPLFEAFRFALELLRARGYGRPGARLRVSPSAAGVHLEVIAPPAPAGEPGPLDR
jgi:hypothetical protein